MLTAKLRSAYTKPQTAESRREQFFRLQQNNMTVIEYTNRSQSLVGSSTLQGRALVERYIVGLPLSEIQIGTRESGTSESLRI